MFNYFAFNPYTCETFLALSELMMESSELQDKIRKYETHLNERLRKDLQTCLGKLSTTTQKMSAPIGAWKCNFPPFWEIMTERHEPNYRQTYGHEGSLESYNSNKPFLRQGMGMYICTVHLLYGIILMCFEFLVLSSHYVRRRRRDRMTFLKSFTPFHWRRRMSLFTNMYSMVT